LNFSISFAPLVPPYVLWAALAVATVVAVLLFLARGRGALLRALALALIIAALANPSFTREDREPLPSVAVLVVDKSASQNFGDRGAQTAAARAELTERLKRIPGLELRTVEAGQSDGESDGTRLFAALGQAFADVPPETYVVTGDGKIAYRHVGPLTESAIKDKILPLLQPQSGKPQG